MHPQQAREVIARQLPSQIDQRSFIQQGRVCYRDIDGSESFLWVPDDESNLYLYGHLVNLTPEVSGQVLAKALALNIERKATCQGAISLNLETHQLVLRDSHAISGDLDINRLLPEFTKRVANLRERLEGVAGTASSTAQPSSPESVRHMPPGIRANHFAP